MPTREEWNDQQRENSSRRDDLLHFPGLGYKLASCRKCKIVRYDDVPMDTDICFDCDVLARPPRAKIAKGVTIKST
jgi:hypothetical protein